MQHINQSNITLPPTSKILNFTFPLIKYKQINQIKIYTFIKETLQYRNLFNKTSPLTFNTFDFLISITEQHNWNFNMKI